jgi:uncharacterized cupin superfamily protein
MARPLVLVEIKLRAIAQLVASKHPAIHGAASSSGASRNGLMLTIMTRGRRAMYPRPPMPKIDLSKAPTFTGTRYPAPFDVPCRNRSSTRLGDAASLTQFGVHLLRLPPESWSSQRHWHALEDEFVWILEGEVVLVTDAGETPMRAGECAGFKAGDRDGHCFQNRSPRDAVLLVVGTRDDKDWGEYPDIDMKFTPGRYSGTQPIFRKKDGTPY